MSLETLLEAAQFIEVETDEDGRTRVKSAQSVPPNLQQYANVKTDNMLPMGTMMIARNDNSPAQPIPIGIAVDMAKSQSEKQASPRAIGSNTRALHNKLEKNRRAHLKECFEELRQQIPNLDDIKASNLSILRNAVRTIQQLIRKEKELEIEMQRLAREKIMSQERISILRMELAAMNIEVDISHFLESHDPDNHSTSTATADEINERIGSDDDNRSSSTLSTTSPNTSGTNFKNPVQFSSPTKSPKVVALPPAITSIPVGTGASFSGPSGYAENLHDHLSTTSGAINATAELLKAPSSVQPKSANRPVTQLLQQAIYQRQENMAQQRSAPKTEATSILKRPSDEGTSWMASLETQPMASSSLASSHKRGRTKKDDAAPAAKSPRTSDPISIQPLIKAEEKQPTLQTSANQPNQPAVLNLNTSAITLNQLLPSRYPAVVNPTIDLGSLLRLSGIQGEVKPTTQTHVLVSTPAQIANTTSGHVATAVTASGAVPGSSSQVLLPGQHLQPATNNVTNLQSAMIANALLQSSQPGVASLKAEQAVAVPKVDPAPSTLTQLPLVATPTTLQPTAAANLASVLGTAAGVQSAAGSMPIQLVTPQQLQQMILQLQLQQQLQQQLAAQLAALEKSGITSATLDTTGSTNASITAAATPTNKTVGQSQASTAATVTPITMPTLGLNQLLQPLATDLSSALGTPQLQLAANPAAANLQQTLAATAQLNQMLVQPQAVLKTLTGQIPLLQQPTLTLPIVVTMPNVVASTAQPVGVNSNSVAMKADEVGVKKDEK